MNLHHAPWSRRFKTFYCKGQYAHELQVGPLVFHWFHKHWDEAMLGRLHIWRDRFWR